MKRPARYPSENPRRTAHRPPSQRLPPPAGYLPARAAGRIATRYAVSSFALLSLGAISIVTRLTGERVDDVCQRRLVTLLVRHLCHLSSLLSELLHALGEVGPIGPDVRLGLTALHLGLECLECDRGCECNGLEVRASIGVRHRRRENLSQSCALLVQRLHDVLTIIDDGLVLILAAQAFVCEVIGMRSHRQQHHGRDT